jgi:VWFA-related protein
VLVPVVVRDSHGRPVAHLTKDDFQLFDKGKRQDIASFSAIERPTDLREHLNNKAASTAKTPQPLSGPANFSTVNKRHILYLFDDTNIRFEDIVHVREAAVDHFKNALAPGDLAAIYTFSGNPNVEFTADREKLESAVSKPWPLRIAS